MKNRTESNWALLNAYTLQIENINELLTVHKKIARIGFKLRKSNKTIEFSRSSQSLPPPPFSVQRKAKCRRL